MEQAQELRNAQALALSYVVSGVVHVPPTRKDDVRQPDDDAKQEEPDDVLVEQEEPCQQTDAPEWSESAIQRLTTPELQQSRDAAVAMAMRASLESTYSFLSRAMLDSTDDDDDDDDNEVYRIVTTSEEDEKPRLPLTTNTPLNLPPVPETKTTYQQKPRSLKQIARVDLAGDIVVVSLDGREETENRDPETAVTTSKALWREPGPPVGTLRMAAGIEENINTPAESSSSVEWRQEPASAVSGDTASMAHQRVLKELAQMSARHIPKATIVMDIDEEEECEQTNDLALAFSVEQERTSFHPTTSNHASQYSLYLSILVGILIAAAIIVPVIVRSHQTDDYSPLRSTDPPTPPNATVPLTTTSTPNHTTVIISDDEGAAVPITSFEFDDVLAFVPETICMDRVPGQGWTALCSPADTMEQGGGACNVVVRAFLDQVPTADVAIQNAGACRNDIAAGNFTYDDAVVLLPFVNRLLTLELSGHQIILVLEQALNHVLVQNSTGGYPYCAGLRYDVNWTAPFLSRISNVQVNERLDSDGLWRPMALELDTTFIVLANSYIVTNEDGYFALGEVSEDLVTDTGKDATETFAVYAKEQGVLLDPPRSEYSTQTFTVEPNSTHFPYR